MTKPLVSIYVTTYNHQDFIAECLEGIVMQQTDFEFEAIVIDDCSTDDTRKIVADYAARYPDIIKPIYNDYNWFRQKKSKVYPLFVNNAQGEYFAICDGDDYWTDPLKLQIQVDFLRSHPKYSACGHLCQLTPSKEILPKWCAKKPTDLNVYDLALDFCVQSSTVMGRMEVFKNDKNLFELIEIRQVPHSDTIVFVALGCSGKVRMINKVLSVYRRYENSMLANTSASEAIQIQDIKYKYIFEMYDPQMPKLKQYLKSKRLIQKSSDYARHRNYIQACVLKLYSLILQPKFTYQLYYRRYKR